MSTEAPDLVADIGGTTARFARLDSQRQPVAIRELACADHPNLPQALAAYLHASDGPPIRSATLALAMPIDGDRLKMTNNPWDFSVAAVRRQFGLDRLTVINDVAAIAWAMPYLPTTMLEPIGQVTGEDGRPIAPPGQLALARRASIGVIGVGTGMGISALVPHGRHGWSVIEGEGGHASFSPGNERDGAILRAAWHRHPHVSAERLLSGTGLTSLHHAVCDVDGLPYQRLTPEQISRHAADRSDPSCVATLVAFSEMLGTVAGNLALTLGARAGICFGGGILARLGPLFDHAAFRRRFEDKGRFAAYTARIGTWLIRAEQPALIGCAHAPQEIPEEVPHQMAHQVPRQMAHQEAHQLAHEVPPATPETPRELPERSPPERPPERPPEGPPPTPVEVPTETPPEVPGPPAGQATVRGQTGR